MLYINKYDYDDIEYLTDMGNENRIPEDETIASSGCGLCCLSMIVENMTTQSLDPVECRDLSYECKANLEPGTDMSILGPVVAEKFGLAYSPGDDMDEVLKVLHSGGMAIARPYGDREGYTGVFSHAPHFVLIISADGDELCVLDPAPEEGKFEEPGRIGKIDQICGPFIYCAASMMDEDCTESSPRYYLFTRKR